MIAALRRQIRADMAARPQTDIGLASVSPTEPGREPLFTFLYIFRRGRYDWWEMIFLYGGEARMMDDGIFYGGQDGLKICNTKQKLIRH